MLSWIFRNAPRLAEAYGAAAPPPLAGARLAAARAELTRAGAAGPRPGRVERRGRAVEARPMPPPLIAASGRK